MLEALSVKGDVIDKPADFDANQFRGHTLYEMARHFVGADSGSLGKKELVGRAFTTSDFPLLLADISNNSLRRGWEETTETWETWCQKGSLSDFKTAKRNNLSQFSDLELVSENGEYKYGSFTEEGESITLATYGKLFPISRQAIINDELGAFTEIPRRMGRAAARVPGDLAYGILTANGLMRDGVALFSVATHANLTTGAGTVITAASVGIMRDRMALQSDASSNANGLNIEAQYLIVPVQLRDVATVLMGSQYDPSSTGDSVPNPVAGSMTVIADPRLSADSAISWYMTAAWDTVEVAFLDGVSAPTLEQQRGWTVDGMEYKVSLDCAASATDWRGMQKNAGA